MLGVKIVTHKLRRDNKPHAGKSYDAKSAFHSGELDDLHEVTKTRLKYEQRTSTANCFLAPSAAGVRGKTRRCYDKGDTKPSWWSGRAAVKLWQRRAKAD